MFFDRPDAGRQALILQINFRQQGIAGASSVVDGAAECAELARTAGIVVVDTITGTRNQPHPRWFVGQGKLDELK